MLELRPYQEDMASYPQLADDIPELETGEMLPELKLVVAVFRRARSDLRSTNAQLRGEARAWFSGHRGSLRLWCELVGVEPERIRRLVAS